MNRHRPLVRTTEMNPWVKNPWAAQNPGPYREGDRVRFPWGRSVVEGVIVEDRGNLGVKGARLYGIKFRVDDITDEMYIELPVEDFHLLRRGASDPKKRGPK
jgi:hypothetical protein